MIEGGSRWQRDAVVAAATALVIVLIGAVSVVGYGQLVVLKNARVHFAGIEELYAYKPLLEALRKPVVDANAKAEADKTTQGDDDAKK